MPPIAGNAKKPRRSLRYAGGVNDRVVTTEASVHPQAAPLASLLGTWTGRGRGRYPTIAEFEYLEEVRFWHTGRPWIGYEQRTWHPESRAPMHSEAGYWRPLPDGAIEVVLSHAFGISELLEGELTEDGFSLRSKSIVSTSTAKRVDGTERVYRLADGALTYDVAMAFGGQAMQNHLTAELHRS